MPSWTVRGGARADGALTRADGAEQVKSMALKKKGRGFSRAHFGHEEHHQQSSAFSRIRHFDSVTGESFGGAQRCTCTRHPAAAAAAAPQSGAP